MWATTSQVFSVLDLPAGPANLQDLTGKATKPSTEDLFDWSKFPPPADGFQFSDSKKAAPLVSVPEEVEDYDTIMCDAEESEFVPPDNLEDLYEAKEGKISDRIEALAPGVGLDTLLDRLEMVIAGDADASEFFGIPSGEEKAAEVVEEETEDPAVYRERCRDVARMFDVIETYKRVGAVVGGLV